MKRSTYLIVCSLTALSLGGCATIFSRSADPVTIESEPSGAEVNIANGAKLGETPFTTAMTRQMNSISVEIKKKGYETKLLKLERKFDLTSLFNLGFISTTSGATSWGIDLLTGNFLEYSPQKYVVELSKRNAHVGPSALEMVVMNHQEFKKNLARNEQGELQASLCHSWELNSEACAKLWSNAYEHRTELLNTPDSLAFYRQLKIQNKEREKT
jgi:hypothetical protein